MRKTILITAGVTLLIALGVVALLAFTPLGLALRQNQGSFDRKHLEAVVAQVRSMSPDAGEENRFRLDDPSNPASLRRLEPNETFARGEGAGTVCASIKPGGALKVVIEIRDLGHAGQYGFAYSDVPLAPKPRGGDASYLDVPGPLQLVRPDDKIDENWWKVFNDLD